MSRDDGRLDKGMGLFSNPFADPGGGFSVSARPNMMDLADYGMDNLGSRANIDPQPDDPMIEVRPTLQGTSVEISDFLSQPVLLDDLETIAGPLLPIEDDFGTERYLRECLAVGRSC